MQTLHKVVRLEGNKWIGIPGYCSLVLNEAFKLQQDVGKRRPDWETKLIQVEIPAGAITPFQAKLIGRVQDCPGDSAGNIAKALLSAPSNARAMLDRLADDGFINKVREDCKGTATFKWAWYPKE